MRTTCTVTRRWLQTRRLLWYSVELSVFLFSRELNRHTLAIAATMSSRADRIFLTLLLSTRPLQSLPYLRSCQAIVWYREYHEDLAVHNQAKPRNIQISILETPPDETRLSTRDATNNTTRIRSQSRMMRPLKSPKGVWTFSQTNFRKPFFRKSLSEFSNLRTGICKVTQPRCFHTSTILRCLPTPPTKHEYGWYYRFS